MPISANVSSAKIRPQGLSGILRVKNDADFLITCIQSCIDALDELIIVYNDCTDNSVDIINDMAEKYTDKIKVYEYPYNVLSHFESKEDFDIANALPDNSPHLLCNYYNFALSKTTYQYAVKIDADQLYFPEVLKEWRDCCHEHGTRKKGAKYRVGWFVNNLLLIHKYIGFRTGHVTIIPQLISDKLYNCYRFYAKTLFVNRADICISLSGVNVFYNKKWMVSLGKSGNNINLLPPFNGEGDHLIFKVSDRTFFTKYNMPYYGHVNNKKYTLIEQFVHPYKILCMGFSWYHLNEMRPGARDKILKSYDELHGAFESISDFVRMKYPKISNKADKTIFTDRQRTIFSFVFEMDKKSISKNAELLKESFSYDRSS